jgi:ATP-binding cassette subfamily F protein 3
MLTFQNLQLRRGPRVLFEDVTFTVFRGERVGITGANGTGKSSLLSLVRGELQPDAGSYSAPPGLRMAWVEQETRAEERSALDFTLDGDAELRETERAIEAQQLAHADHDGARLASCHAHYEAIGGYTARSRAGQLLAGIGFAPDELAKPVAAFSGGWRVRLNLARALMCRSDLLLLDEPTNHLDLDAVLWLERFLLAYRGTLLLISHDREFLDRVVTRIAHIERQSIRVYAGNYSQFEVQRAAELAVHQSMYERQQREIRHIEEFVARFRAKATKARQAQSRLKLLERMERIAPAHVDGQFQFSFAEPEKLPRPLLTLEGASAGYGGRTVIERLEFALVPGDRIALLGRNGAGKSTFTKLLAGELAPADGKRIAAPDLRVGYFAQHQLEQLDPALDAFTHVLRFGGPAFARAADQEVRDHLGGFGFRGERVFEPVAPFSGGEKARLVLALLVAQRPNLLLLDEPTNHLDLEMRHALGMALQDFTGALVVVSHDRHLVRSIADSLWLVANCQAAPFDGDLDDYAEWLARPGETAPEAADAGTDTAQERRAQKRAEAERRNRLSPLRTGIRNLEEEIAKLEAERASIEAALAEPAIYAAALKDELRRQLERRREVARALAHAEERWIAASEELERAQQEP